MSRSSHSRLMRRLGTKKELTMADQTQEQKNVAYGQACAKLGDAILKSRLLGQDIENLFSQLHKMVEESKANVEVPAAADVIPNSNQAAVSGANND